MEEDVFTVGEMADGAPEVWDPSLAMRNHYEPASCQLHFLFEKQAHTVVATEGNKQKL